MVTKRELSTTAKLSAFKSIFVMFLTCGNESCVMTKECYLKCKRQRWDLCEEFKVWCFATKCAAVKFVSLHVEPLLRIERSQICWFGHVTRMSKERLARHILLATPASWRGYISDLPWSRLGLSCGVIRTN